MKWFNSSIVLPFFILLLTPVIYSCSGDGLSETDGVEIVDLNSSLLLDRAWYLNSFVDEVGEIEIAQASSTYGLILRPDGEAAVLTECAEIPTTYTFDLGVITIEPLASEALLCGGSSDIESVSDRERFAQIFSTPFRMLDNGIGIKLTGIGDVDVQLINPRQLLRSEEWRLASYTMDGVNRLTPVSGTRYIIDFSGSDRTSGIFECANITSRYALLANLVELSGASVDDADCTVDVDGYLEQTRFISSLYFRFPLTVNFAEGGLVLSASNEERLYFR